MTALSATVRWPMTRAGQHRRYHQACVISTLPSLFFFANPFFHAQHITAFDSSMCHFPSRSPRAGCVLLVGTNACFYVDLVCL